MKKQILNTRKFSMPKTISVLAVVALIALLFMLQPVADAVVKAGTAAGVNMPPVPIFRQTAGNIFLAAVGLFLLLISAIFVVPIVKFAAIGAGLALAGYGIYQIYKLIKGEPVQDILPRK